MTPTAESKNSDTKKQKKKKKYLRIIVILILIILLLLLCLSKCTADTQPSNTDIMQGVISVPDGFDSQQYINDIVEDGMFQVFVNSDIIVLDDGRVPLFAQNSEKNKNSMYIELLDENKNTLYVSDIIAPGYKIEYTTFKLPTEGKHNCLAVIHILDDNGAKLNTITGKVVLTV